MTGIEQVGAAVPPAQRRPVLRQPRRRPGAHLEQLLHQQHPLGALPAVDAGGRQPRDREGATARSGCGAYQTYFDAAVDRDRRRTRRPVVRVHGRLGAGRSCCRTTTTPCRTAATSTSAATPAAASWPGWRRSCKARAGRPRRRLGRRLHAPGDDQLLRRQRRRPRPARRSTARCSTSTASTWWSAATSTTTSARCAVRGVVSGSETLTPNPVSTAHRRHRHLASAPCT